MSALELFQFDGRDVRVIVIDGEPWWAADDVAAALDYSRGRDMVRLLDEDMKGAHEMRTPGGTQPVTVISRSGVYRLIMRSTKPEARRFERLVVDEILPTIARTGSYAVPAQPDVAAIDRRALALMVIEAEDARAVAEQKIAELEPRARLADTVMSADGDWSVREAAQVLNRDPAISTGQRRLFGTLRELGWVDRRGTPYQRHIEAGRISTRVRVYDHPHTGEPTLADPQVRITGKGLTELHAKLGGSEPLKTLDGVS